jgi:4-methylaminobutanoate oxidase (formaldehyde-forming)
VYSMGRQNWFGAVAAEHAHVRGRVGLFDQTSFAKYEVSGDGADAALQWICAGDVAKAPGRVTYTQCLNTRGGIEADLTVARLSPDLFYIVTGTGFRAHDADWITRHLPKGVGFRDVTEDWGTLSLMGPDARRALAAVTPDDVSNAGFPFGHVRDLTVAGVPVRAIRITYVGELGWELHVPLAGLAQVFDALMATDADVRPVGYRALESLRLEKGYRAWAADITPNDTPMEAGLGWAVKMRGNMGFLGRDALEAAVARPLAKRLAGFTVDDPAAVLLGRETILRDGVPVGYLTSGGHGHTIGMGIGYGYVRNAGGVTEDWLMAGRYSLIVAAQEFPARIGLRPFHDPDGARIRA